MFTICKVKSYFSTKDPIPSCFKSSVIYNFKCARCNSCYVGRTHIHFNTRRNQHLETDKKSSIFKHSKNNVGCGNMCNEESFKILDSAKSDYELAIKESMYIKWLKPDLNVQKRHLILKLLL